MKKFLLIAAACCFAASAVVAGTMMTKSLPPPIPTPKPSWAGDAILASTDPATTTATFQMGSSSSTITYSATTNAVVTIGTIAGGGGGGMVVVCQTNDGTIVDSSACATNAIGTIAAGGHSVVINGAFDVNCHPRRDPRELMAANETPEQINRRIVPRTEQLATVE